MRRFVLWLAFLVIFGFLMVPGVLAGSAGRRGADDDTQFQQRRNERDGSLEKMEKDAAKRRNKERQERIKQDTDKLLSLATELKEYVDKSNENILSLDVIRKAEQIEKLAHQVREKMKAEP